MISKQMFVTSFSRSMVREKCLSGWYWALLERIVLQGVATSHLRNQELHDEEIGYIWCYNTTRNGKSFKPNFGPDIVREIVG